MNVIGGAPASVGGHFTADVMATAGDRGGGDYATSARVAAEEEETKGREARENAAAAALLRSGQGPRSGSGGTSRAKPAWMKL